MSNADKSNAVKNNKTKLTKVNLTEFKLDKEMKTLISAKSSFLLEFLLGYASMRFKSLLQNILYIKSADSRK